MIPVSPRTTTSTPAEYAAFSRVRWGAILAGALVALVVTVALNLLGLGIGFASINPTTEANPFSGIGIGAIIWYVVASLIALYAGGFVAGKMSGFPKASNAGLHGLLSWALFTLVSLYLFTTAVGRVVSGVGSAISSVTSGVTNAVGAAVPNNLDAKIGDLIDQNTNTNITFSDIRNEAYQLLEDTDKASLDPDNLRQDANQVGNAAQRNADDVANSPYAAGKEINGVLDRIQAKGGKVVDAADKDAFINVLVNRSDMSEAEARDAVNGWSSRIETQANKISSSVEQGMEQAGETAKVVGGDVADGLSTAALLGFVGLLLGALAAYFGGASGRQHDLTLTPGDTVNAGQV
ncbi:TIGR04086 family membrane protein [Neolewinella antarctica]|uniref:PhnA-like protein n=1 Tax=Neolewinella antarctica TaxID=442734 RepID=A0ABX0X8V5_9BACT|nr:TIGR04086 family membrane protein [Neolewinella antarctica]NJC25696.1 hypothetical protein [Neolewinella antarctica]